MPVKLTGVERVKRMFARQEQDRVPARRIILGGDHRTVARYQGLSGDAGAVIDMLDGDMHQLCWVWPEPFRDRSKTISRDADTFVQHDGHGKRCVLAEQKRYA